MIYRQTMPLQSNTYANLITPISPHDFPTITANTLRRPSPHDTNWHTYTRTFRTVEIRQRCSLVHAALSLRGKSKRRKKITSDK